MGRGSSLVELYLKSCSPAVSKLYLSTEVGVTLPGGTDVTLGVGEDSFLLEALWILEAHRCL